MSIVTVFFLEYAIHLSLHSFPTRRSSDLVGKTEEKKKKENTMPEGLSLVKHVILCACVNTLASRRSTELAAVAGYEKTLT